MSAPFFGVFSCLSATPPRNISEKRIRPSASRRKLARFYARLALSDWRAVGSVLALHGWVSLRRVDREFGTFGIEAFLESRAILE